MNKTRVRIVRPLVGALSLAAALAAPNALAQGVFPTPEAAGNALVDAIATRDPDALRAVLGADWKRYIPTAGVDDEDVYAFLAAAAKSKSIVTDSPQQAHLVVGSTGWTLPIPIVKRGSGWAFDPRAGADEIRTRRIGRNELDAVQAALAYVDAQNEYAAEDRDGDGRPEFAQRIVSTPGKQDGLYWAALPGEPESPLGPVFAGDLPGSDGYHGYRFHILKAQGPGAPGGARSYVVNGHMTEGFALVAWPAKYGETGVKTFIVSRDGQVYEKNLGPKTDANARAMTRFDPDSSWSKVAP
jgi:hypothetical protein